MAPIIEVSNETLKTLNPDVYTLRDDLDTQTKDNFDYVPSINLWVAKEKTLFGETWFNSHKMLQEQGQRMLNLREFVEYLKYQRENNPDIYRGIIEVRSPRRLEWLDADFKMKDKKLYLNTNHILENGELIPQYSKPVTKNTLMKNKTPGISLEAWLNNPTAQGLPRKNINKGDLYYLAPMDDNNSVAGFNAGVGWASFNCDWGPSYRYSDLGVRVAKQLG